MMLLDPLDKTATALARFLDIQTSKTRFSFRGGALAEIGASPPSNLIFFRKFFFLRIMRLKIHQKFGCGGLNSKKNLDLAYPNSDST